MKNATRADSPQQMTGMNVGKRAQKTATKGTIHFR